MSDLGRDATSAPRSAAVASLAVVGTGLIGGSFAKAVRKQGLFDRIVGLDANPDRAAEALRLGLVDEVAKTVPAEAEAVLLAVPTEAVGPWGAQSPRAYRRGVRCRQRQRRRHRIRAGIPAGLAVPLCALPPHRRLRAQRAP